MPDPSRRPAPDREPPTVTIAIPTFDRPDGLRRALDSARAQDAVTEIVVSDNASTDPEVRRVAERAAAADARVAYVRQPVNRGHAANFQWLLEHARGELFMWLADDDWIDPGYVARCAQVLLGDGAVLVCGQGRYYAGGRHVLDERPIELRAADPARRLLAYFARVSLNGPMSGLMRRADALAVGFAPTLAGDWLFVAAMARRGEVRTLPDVHLHRSLTGMGSDAAALSEDLGRRGSADARMHLSIAARMFGQAVTGELAIPGTGIARRLGVGAAVAGLIAARFSGAELVRWLLGRHAARLEAAVGHWLRRREPPARSPSS